MIRIMVMNGLLISLILIWTSAAKEPSAGYLIKSSTKPPTGPLNYSVSKPMVSLHETNKEILRRKFLCGSELGGVCVNKKKSCPSNLPSEKSPGKPYCSKKKDRCCYPDPTTAAPPTVVPTTTTTSEDVNWSDIRNACIKSNNYKTYQPLTLDICKEKCVEEDAINCQSIEYSSAQQMCAISEARSDSDDFIEPCFVDGWVFAERELNTGPTTGAPTTLAPSNTTINGQTTNPPTTTAPSNTTNNVSSCNLVWNYEEDRPLIMIRETKTIVPPIIDIEISEDPNRIPEGKKLIFACPGENNQFNHVQGTHTKLHGECISHEQFKVCVNNYPEILDLSQLSCSSKMQPSIIKQDNDTSYEKSCEDIGGELYKFGYIYGDYREFKDLDTKFCFREKDQTTLWTSTNIDRIEISPSMRSMDPANFRTARGLAMNTFYSQKSQQETLKEILDKEVKSVWNDKACRNHGGHCVRGGRPCPKHLPHHTSQGEPFCTSFYRCCYSEQCDPTTCTYKGKKGKCSLDSLPVTTGVGSQECKKGCQCYIKDTKTLRQFESLQERMGNDQRTRCDGEVPTGDICGLRSVKSRNKSSNQTSRLSSRSLLDCSVDWNLVVEEFGDKPCIGKPPLILSGDRANIISTIRRIKHSEFLNFACPGENNHFIRLDLQPIKLLEVSCRDGDLYHSGNTEFYDLSYLGCKVYITPTIEPMPQGPTMCNGDMYAIVYELQPQPLLVYVTSMKACFDNDHKTTRWIEHIIDGENIMWHEFIKSPQFKVETKHLWGNTVDIALEYQTSDQNVFFMTKFGKPNDFIELKNQKYLAKGHMAAKADFALPAEQRATFLYINALPQWQKINNGNWVKIETLVRQLASCWRGDLLIYSGGHNVMKMKDGTGTFKQVYLGPGNKEVPVPEITWKVVSTGEKAVAFVVFNNPFGENVLPNYAKGNKCGMLDAWLYMTPAELNDHTKGITYCFQVNDFRETFKNPINNVYEIVFPQLGNAETQLLTTF